MPKVSIVLSHWPKLIENLEASPLQFYKSVEEAISRRVIPDTVNSRIDWKEGGVFTADREYLRITRGAHSFDVCGAPFGTGFFVSTWLVEERNSLGVFEILGLIMGFCLLPLGLIYFLGLSLGIMATLVGVPAIAIVLAQYLESNRPGWDDFIVGLPVVGPMYERLVRPATYYRIDTAMMFQQAVQAAVMEVVDRLMEAKGLRGLSELERKPVLKAVAVAG
jgi:hypothetical protein